MAPFFRFTLIISLLWGLSFVVYSEEVSEAPQTSHDEGKPRWSGEGVPSLSNPLDSNLWAYFDTAQTQGVLGVSIYSQKEQKYLTQFRADSLFTPASTLKLLTTSTALSLLDLDWRPKTQLEFQGIRTGSQFEGQIKIIGGGDPNLSGRYFPSAIQSLDSLVQQVVNLGLDTLKGEFVTDTTLYHSPLRPATWESRFYDQWYGAEVNALSFNDNCILIKVIPGEAPGDSVTVEVFPDLPYMDIQTEIKTVKGRYSRIKKIFSRDSNVVSLSGTMGYKAQARTYVLPVRRADLYFKTALIEALKLRGVYYQPQELPRDSLGTLLLKTPFQTTLTNLGLPLLSLLDEINQRSQNLHAETLFRHVGKAYADSASVESGSQAVKSFVAKKGFAQDTARIKILDGSGLSYGNKITPNLMVGVLKGMLSDIRKDYFIQSLAEPTVATSGKRLKELEYPWRSKYKTGFINHTQGLTGYIFTALGDTLSVALYINKYKTPDYKARDMMDSMWIKIANYYDTERPSLMKAREFHQYAEIMGTPEYQWNPSKYQQRLLKFSKYMMGIPYGRGGPTGEGMYQSLERKPLINLDELDCVTYIETVMALARAESPDDIMNELQGIRYIDSTVDFYKRRHFFVEDWVYNNPRVQLKRFPGDTSYIRISDKSKFYEFKKLDYAGDNPQTNLSYLPLDKAIKLFKAPWSGEPMVLGFGLVGKLDWLWVTHTGFLILEPGQKPVMRHASLKKSQVIDMDLSTYLKSRKKSLEGIMFFEFNEMTTKREYHEN